MENKEFETQPLQETEVLQEPQTEVLQQPDCGMPVAEQPVTETPAAPRNFIDEVKDSDVVKQVGSFIDKAKQSAAADSAREFIDKAKNSSAAGGVRNFFGKLKQVPVKVWAIAGIALVAILAVILIVGAASNTYKTPLDLTVKIMNAQKFDKALDLAADSLNGVCETEAKNIIKIIKKSDLYKDNKDDINDQMDELIEGLKDEYGSNYKITYKVTEKEKIDKDDCEDYEDQLKSLGKAAVNAVKEIDNDQIKEMAEQTGLSKSECKKLIEELESAGKKLKKVKVTAGYELEVTLMLKGSELDEPEEMELSVNVYKVNGRWMLDYVSLAQSYIGMIMGSLDLDLF